MYLQMEGWWVFIFGGLISGVLTELTVKEKREIKCAVCRAVVYEVNNKILSVNPKKTIEIGSYRIDSNGNQGTKAVSYARSETHLVEVMEKICDEMKDYWQTTLKNGQKSILSTKKRDNEPLRLENLEMSHSNSATIRRMCEETVSEHDDDIIEIYTNTDNTLEGIERSVCSQEMTGHCTDEDFILPFPNTNGAVKDKTEDKDGDKEEVDEKDENKDVNNKDSVKDDEKLSADRTEL